MAGRTMPAVMEEVKNFRLILSDTLVEGGQRVKTFSLMRGEIDVMTVESIVARLNENFGFRELLKERQVSMEALMGDGGGFSLVGTDGSRHAPIRTDEQLVSFFKTIRYSKLPSLEVKVSKPGGHHKPAAREAPRTERRAPRDRIEELEDQNFKINKATQKVQKQVDALERVVSTEREETARLVNDLRKEMSDIIKANFEYATQELQSLREADEGINVEIEFIRKTIKEHDIKNYQRHQQVTKELEDLNQSMREQFEDVQNELERQRQVDQELKEEDEREERMLQKHAIEMKRIDDVKVEIVHWRAEEEAMAQRITDETTAIRKELADTAADIRWHMKKQREELDEADKALAAELQATTDRIDGELRRLEHEMNTGFTKTNEKIDTTRLELLTKFETDIKTLSMSTDDRFAEMKVLVKSNDKEIHKKVDALSEKTELTFQKVESRMDNLVKAERSRLGNIERDLQEGTAKLRSDVRAEVERVRVDYEQEAARLDGDLSDLHTKHDVVKQEINFFQSRLLEQRDWAQRQFAETATATRAAQVDAQEGVAATTKMAHALRDDQVAFRDKMAKHISHLQHASDSYGDAINALETQRSRMRLELDAILSDHKSYVMDMDGWADDVRVKVERLFKAMEPPRCEWRINNANVKFKDMKKPLAVRSPNFALQGLRDVRFELYPHGHNHSPEGKAVLRICMPPKSAVRYQCWLGTLSEGSKEYESGGSLSVDLVFDSWKDQILEDGGLVMTMEILQDLTNADESLKRAVLLET